MGQKTSSNLLRLDFNNNEWKSKYNTKTPEESSLIVFKDLKIKEYLEQLMIKNGLILHQYKMHVNNNTLYLYVSYFICLKSTYLINLITSDQKIKLNKINKHKYKHVYQKTKNTKKSSKTIIKQKDFISKTIYKRCSILKKQKNDRNDFYLNDFKTNNFSEQILEALNLFTNRNYNTYLTFRNLNSNLTVKLKKEIWRKKLLQLKRYKKQEFFKESINVILIVLKSKNSAELFAKFLTKYISTLKKHFYFILFIKQALNLFLTSDLSKIIGVKIIINGRLNGKPRARNNIIIVGNMPTQTLKTNIDYYQSTAFSSNGTLGIKVWIAEK